MRPMKRAHCTESLFQRPPPRVLALWLLLGLASVTLAQAPATEDNAAKTGEPATQSPLAKPTPVEPPYASREERDMKLLAERVNADAIVWLKALEEPFLSLYERELTGNAVGAALIINAEGQHSSWPSTTERIRLSLPQVGWNTLSTELPEADRHAPPKRTWNATAPAPPKTDSATQENANENTDQSTDDSAPSDAPTPASEQEIYDDQTGELSDGSIDSGNDSAPTAIADELKIPSEDIATARLQESINYLHQQGQFNIVVMGSGIGAARAACFADTLPKVNSATQTRLIRAMVLINARNHVPGTDQWLHKCLTYPEIPVLDVYIGLGERDRQEAKERLSYSRRKNYGVYQQIRLPELAHNTARGENRLSRRIRGFLEQHAQGVKVNNAVIKTQ